MRYRRTVLDEKGSCPAVQRPSRRNAFPSAACLQGPHPYRGAFFALPPDCSGVREASVILRVYPRFLPSFSRGSSACPDRGREPANSYPRTCTALKLNTTCPPAVGRPKLIIGRNRENKSIWSR